ncbi:c-type cytochrome [Bordetella genomosp. 9]|uniref:Cytochrome C n=1 Tax=Bordetella genomosp. 9 TaxID=1416803 RepID=A0A1W6Z5S3_9BORD|nr:c-type cytochrome [Bordetella genomosp. 9]ARP88534.1 cytochrome C [Bordetella genomosp. 9]ARP92499.1 cytochrome C [Bordetella genomosp. 9]
MRLKIDAISTRAAIAVLGTFLMQGAMAQTLGESLVRDKVCLGCHQVDSARVGPPFTAIAQRYGGQPGAEDYLANSIRNGGRYRWGKLSMAAQPQVSPEEAHEIARWILSLAPAKQQP